MGCDIHIIVERQARDGVWQRIWELDDEYNEPAHTPEIFGNRNYDLFGILGDVRNGHGFAGCVTGSGWPSIAPDRGVPVDSTLTVDEMEDYTIGDHSYTWVGLEELHAYDWDGVRAEAYGIVSREEYARMQHEGDSCPKAWCGGISGRDVLVVTPEQLLRSTAPIPFSHVSVKWTESARDGTRDWPGKVIPWLDTLAAGQPLRLVFGFDS